MAHGISEICDEIIRLVELATPDYEPGYTWREASYSAPLEELEVTARVSDSMRGFQVLPLPTATVFSWSRSPSFVGEVHLSVRYVADRTRDSIERVWRMAASDADRLHRQICEPGRADAWAGSTVAHVEGITMEFADLAQSPSQPTIWILTLGFRPQYYLGD